MSSYLQFMMRRANIDDASYKTSSNEYVTLATFTRSSDVYNAFVHSDVVNIPYAFAQDGDDDKESFVVLHAHDFTSVINERRAIMNAYVDKLSSYNDALASFGRNECSIHQFIDVIKTYDIDVDDECDDDNDDMMSYVLNKTYELRRAIIDEIDLIARIKMLHDIAYEHELCDVDDTTYEIVANYD